MLTNPELLIPFTLWLGGKAIDKGFDNLFSKFTASDKKKLDRKFVDCIEKTALKFEKEYPDLLGNSIDFFFKQQDNFDELCNVLIFNHEINIEKISDSFDTKTIPNDFIIRFIEEFKFQLSHVKDFQPLIYKKELFYKIDGISKNINAIAIALKTEQNSQFDIENFKEKYYKNLVSTLRTINFLGLKTNEQGSANKGKRKDITRIFVDPKFKSDDIILKHEEFPEYITLYPSTSSSGNKIKFESLIRILDNLIILGHPGTGKSTLVKALICKIASKSHPNIEQNSIWNIIPFRIELKEYLTYKNEYNGNIVNYICHSLDHDFFVSNISKDNISQILSRHNTIIFFDGFDEIFLHRDKLHIKNDIENFHNNYPNARSITTSRIIGYEDIKLNEEHFKRLVLLPFENEQIKQYINSWYQIEEENEQTRNEETELLFSKLDQIDNELLSNPLLLSLIVILFRNNLSIPESRLEIYESCTKTLMFNWDDFKNLNINLDNTLIQKREYILTDLAFWQYKLLSSNQSEITYTLVKNKIIDTLIEKKICEPYESENAAELFLEYAHKRSIYFDNNFTHKTFLEYYTALWIFSNFEMKHKVSKRNKLISKYISNPFWYIVLELLINMIDRKQSDNEIIDEIFLHHFELSEKSFPFLIYCLSSLKNISKEMCSRVYKNSILCMLYKDVSHKLQSDIYLQISRNLDNNVQWKLIISTIKAFNKEDKKTNYYVFLIDILMNSQVGVKFKNIKDLLRNELMDEFNSFAFKRLVYSNSFLFKSYYLVEPRSLNTKRLPKHRSFKRTYIQKTIKFIQLFGRENLFEIIRSPYGGFYMSSYFNLYIIQQILPHNIKDIQDNILSFRELNVMPENIILYMSKGSVYFNLQLGSLNHLAQLAQDERVSEMERILYMTIIKFGFKSSQNGKEIDTTSLIASIKAPDNLKDLIHEIQNSRFPEFIYIIENGLNIKNNPLSQIIDKTMNPI